MIDLCAADCKNEPESHSDSHLFQTAEGALPGDSNTMTIQHTNKHITQNNTIKTNK
jgi:hypothetical protein